MWVKPKGGWRSETQKAKLTASDGAANDKLGDSAAISGNTVVAGAIGATVNGNADQGAVYVFASREAAGATRRSGEADRLRRRRERLPGWLAGDPGQHHRGRRADALLPLAGAAYVFVEPRAAGAAGPRPRS